MAFLQAVDKGGNGENGKSEEYQPETESTNDRKGHMITQVQFFGADSFILILLMSN